jgi:hypothetical protein
MYFSKKHRFAFMHINKTGGRSLTEYLTKTIPDFKLTGLGHRAVHKPYYWLKSRNILPADFRLVTIIRNPRERYESLYRYRKMKYNKGMLDEQNREAAGLEFNEWFYRQMDSDNPLDQPQADWLPESDQLRDRILYLQLEHIRDDVTEMFKAFGIPSAGIEFPHINKSPKEPITWYKNSIIPLELREEWIYNNFYRIGGNL